MTFLEAEEALKNLTISYNKLGILEATNVHLEHFKKALVKAKTSKKKKINIYDFYELSKKPKNPSDTSPK